MILFIKQIALAQELKNHYKASFPDASFYLPHHVICGDEHPLCPILSENDPEKFILVSWGMDLNYVEFKEGENILSIPVEMLKENYFPAGLQRCIIPVNAYYDHSINEEGEICQYELKLDNDDVFSIAGMCGTFFDPASERTLDFLVILMCPTYDALPLLCNIERMPLVVRDPQAWLKYGEYELIRDFVVEYIEPEQAARMFTSPNPGEDPDNFSEDEQDPGKRA